MQIIASHFTFFEGMRKLGEDQGLAARVLLSGNWPGPNALRLFSFSPDFRRFAAFELSKAKYITAPQRKHIYDTY